MSKNQPGTVEKNSSTIGPPAGIEPTPLRCRCTACVRFNSSLRHIYPSEFALSRVKCHKILIDLPSNLFAGITTLNYTIITLALVSYLRSSVVRALHRHRKGVGSIPAGGPIVDEFFSTVSGWFFDMCTIQLEPKTHLPFRI